MVKHCIGCIKAKVQTKIHKSQCGAKSQLHDSLLLNQLLRVYCPFYEITQLNKYNGPAAHVAAPQKVILEVNILHF